jgi:hypothetical protein
VSTLDVLVLIPVVPLFPVIATWWLPWERWIPNAVPKSILGLYLLYASFAAWYFGFSWWLVVMVAALGAIASTAAIVKMVESK